MSSTTAPSFTEVRDDIVGQHGRLRLLLNRLDSAAERVVRSKRCAPSELDGALDGLVRELATHMAFEEAALSTVAGAGTWEPNELTRLRREHQRQRDELTRITREAHGSDDPISLALAIRAFASDVLLDMNLEEDRLQRLGVSDW